MPTFTPAITLRFTTDMRLHLPRTVQTRDAALGRLSRINRLLIAGSVTLTGVFADVAANAFPGRTLHSDSKSTPNQSSQNGHSAQAHDSHSDGPLRAPAEAPKPAGEGTSESTPPEQPASTTESRPSTESAPAQEPAGSESKSTPESAPTHEPTPEAAHESAPAPPANEQPAPVVSGGS